MPSCFVILRPQPKDPFFPTADTLDVEGHLSFDCHPEAAAEGSVPPTIRRRPTLKATYRMTVILRPQPKDPFSPQIPYPRLRCTIRQYRVS